MRRATAFDPKRTCALFAIPARNTVLVAQSEGQGAMRTQMSLVTATVLAVGALLGSLTASGPLVTIAQAQSQPNTFADRLTYSPTVWGCTCTSIQTSTFRLFASLQVRNVSRVRALT